MTTQEWREYTESQQYQAWYVQDYLGEVNTAKMLNGHTLRREEGGTLHTGEVDSYCSPYRGASFHYVRPEYVVDMLPKRIGAFKAERKAMSENEYIIFCDCENVRFSEIEYEIYARQYVGTFSIEADFFHENVLLKADNDFAQEYIYIVLKSLYNGVEKIGENRYINVPFKKCSCSNAGVILEFDSKIKLLEPTKKYTRYSLLGEEE